MYYVVLYYVVSWSLCYLINISFSNIGFRSLAVIKSPEKAPLGDTCWESILSYRRTNEYTNTHMYGSDYLPFFTLIALSFPDVYCGFDYIYDSYSDFDASIWLPMSMNFGYPPQLIHPTENGLHVIWCFKNI